MATESYDPTVPLDDSLKETVTFNGREYQQYSIQNNVYFSPIDEDEVDRLQISHEALKRAFGNQLILPPVRRLRKVLDCGFGTGAWAIEVAAEHPECKVLGIDVSPHMAQDDDLPNLEFQVDDLNRRFTFDTGEFDLVHSQMVAGGIDAGRWKSYLKDIHRVLRPGGWCQIVEIYFQAQSDNGSLTDNHALRQWSQLYLQSLSAYKDPRAPVRMEELVRRAGFTEVQCWTIQMPMSDWSTDPVMKEVGQINRDNIHRMLASQAMYLFTERLRMAYDQTQVLIAQARAEADNPSIKVRKPSVEEDMLTWHDEEGDMEAYFPLYVCIGRKRH